jgi:hypothetical protein
MVPHREPVPRLRYKCLVMSSEIENLHESTFGFRPAKLGAAYERLTAVVLAALGWVDVVQDTVEHSPGKRASHQLDVTARHPDGTVRRLIVECKDWKTTVGKNALDALVGRRSQLGADAAAVLTTRGFTEGAVGVASDECVSLLVLRRFNPASPDLFARTVTLVTEFFYPVRSNWSVDFLPGLALPPNVKLRISSPDRLLHLNGDLAETVEDILKAHASPMTEGVFQQQADFPDGRLIPTANGSPIAITALRWTETMHKSSITHVSEGQGEPELVLEQIDDNGEVTDGRIVVDRELNAWNIDADGNVVPRGRLGSS